MAVPNQKIIQINKSFLVPPFLQVSEEELFDAARSLNRTEFILYLYFAKNADGYQLEFSPTAVANLGLMSKSSATEARQGLEKKGYIENDIFYTASRERREKIKQIEQEIERGA